MRKTAKDTVLPKSNKRNWQKPEESSSSSSSDVLQQGEHNGGNERNAIQRFGTRIRYCEPSSARQLRPATHSSVTPNLEFKI